MNLYDVDGVTVFTAPPDTVVSYLVHHDWATDQHYSYAFNPADMEVDVAMRVFQRLLDEGKATRFDPNGGRLDGKDLT